MNKIIILTKMFLKNNIKEIPLFSSEKVNIKGISLVIFVIVLSVLFPIMSNIYNILAIIGQEGMLLGIGLNLVSFIIFIFGISTTISVFYFGKDIENLLSLPVRSYEITISKLIVSAIFEYILTATILFPLLCVYGVKSHANVFYILKSIIIFILIPILPIVYSGIISVLLMSFTSLSKHKDKFKIVVGSLGFFLALGINILGNQYTNKGVTRDVANKLLAQGDNSIVSTISLFFPTVKLGTYSLLGHNSIVNIILCLLISVIGIIIFIFIAEKLYINGALGVSETYAKRQNLNDKLVNKKVKQNSKIVSLFKYEIIILFRTPAYFVNCVINIITTPILIIVLFLFRGDLHKFVNEVSNTICSNPGKFTMFSIGIMFFIASSSNIASTSVSREGRNIFIRKYLPVNYYNQLKAKVLVSAFIEIVLFIIIDISIMLIKPKLILGVFLMVIAIEISIVTSIVGVLIDLQSPKLRWESEEYAIKQNFNSLTSAISNIVIGGVLVGLMVILKLNYLLELFIISILLIALIIIFMKKMKSSSQILFDDICEKNNI